MSINPSKNPFDLFNDWFDQACEREPDYPNAMTLASVDAKGIPSARIVLLKEHDTEGFAFYTNFESRKGKEILKNPNVALVFYWKSLQKQIRIEGVAAQVSDERAQSYYDSRPRLSRLGAWASQQSRPLRDRETLEQRVKDYDQQFDGQEFFPRPPYWSGFLVKPKRFEFWEEIEFRLHDRFIFDLDKTGNWVATRLYP